LHSQEMISKKQVSRLVEGFLGVKQETSASR
jgi:hypothetical protein